MAPRIVMILVTVLAALCFSACSAPGPAPEPLPPGPELIGRAADVMAKVRTVAVSVEVDPTLAELPIRSAAGKLTAAGEATGTALLALFGSPPVEYQFVVTRGSLYLKGATGGYQRLPLEMAAAVYDPTVLMRPDVGVAALLRTATGAVTEGSDAVNGVPAYRVRATLDPRLVSTVVPGIGGADRGRVWVDKATGRPLKAQIDIPTDVTRPDSPTAPVTVTMSDFDAPVTVTAPTGS